eukprot:TRINITY_DN2417_c0_g2_i3.p1 TRINITY_DN2417_c0_g2~~TRINITY_DN2417_c0_g2_i3.p1  ORF type:complete len:1017 (+),score=155.25 TRINITY_DN2417_c0_g2_i3:83-3133(+)
MYEILVTLLTLLVVGNADVIQEYYFVIEADTSLSDSCTEMIGTSSDKKEVIELCRNTSTCHAIEEDKGRKLFRPKTCDLQNRTIAQNTSASVYFKTWMGTFCTDDTVAAVSQAVEKLTTVATNRKVEPSVYGASRCVRETDNTTAVAVHLDSLDPSIQDVIDCNDSSKANANCPTVRGLDFTFVSYLSCTQSPLSEVEKDLQAAWQTDAVRVSNYYTISVCSDAGSKTVIIYAPQDKESLLKDCVLDPSAHCKSSGLTTTDGGSEYNFASCVKYTPVDSNDYLTPTRVVQGIFGIANSVIRVTGTSTLMCPVGYENLEINVMKYILYRGMRVSPDFMMPLRSSTVCIDYLNPRNISLNVETTEGLVSGFLTFDTPIVVRTGFTSNSKLCNMNTTQPVSIYGTQPQVDLINTCLKYPNSANCTNFPLSVKRHLPIIDHDFCLFKGDNLTASIEAAGHEINILAGENYTLVAADPENCSGKYAHMKVAVYDESVFYASDAPKSVIAPILKLFCSVVDTVTLHSQLETFFNDTLVLAPFTGRVKCPTSRNQASWDLLPLPYLEKIRYCSNPKIFSLDALCATFPPSLVVSGVEVCSTLYESQIEELLETFLGDRTTVEAAPYLNCELSSGSGRIIQHLTDAETDSVIQCIQSASCSDLSSALKFTAGEPAVESRYFCAPDSIDVQTLNRSALIAVAQDTQWSDKSSMTIPLTNMYKACDTGYWLVNATFPSSALSKIEYCTTDTTFSDYCTTLNMLSHSFDYYPSNQGTPIQVCLLLDDNTKPEEFDVAAVAPQIRNFTDSYFSRSNREPVVTTPGVGECASGRIAIQIAAVTDILYFIQECTQDPSSSNECAELPSMTPIVIIQTYSKLICVTGDRQSPGSAISDMKGDLMSFLELSALDVVRDSSTDAFCPSGTMGATAMMLQESIDRMMLCESTPLDDSCSKYPKGLSAPSGSRNDDDDSSVFPVIFIIIIVVVVVGLIASIVLYVRKGKSNVTFEQSDQNDSGEYIPMEANEELA